MKIILSTDAPGLEANLDPRFGRAAYFLLIDPATKEWEAVMNPALYSSGGAGVQAAQLATQHQCSAVISGEFGPNAYNSLAAVGVDMYKYGNCTSIQDVLDRYNAGQLEKVLSPGSAGHHGR